MFDFWKALGIMAILGGVMLIAKLCAKRLTAEWSRKIIHVTMGGVALTLPFIIENKQTVVFLGVAALAALLTLRLNKRLREGIGTALLGISRKSYGEVYFVFSIVIVYTLHQSTYEYIISILVLTFADSMAALIGTSYGRSNLAVAGEDTKSREGSVVFFTVAFICALVPLQLMTEIGRAEVLVISFLVGLLGAMIEMVSSNGNDNLLLPLLTYSFIRYNSSQPIERLFINFGVMLLLLVSIIFVYKKANITKLSIVYGLLAGYIFMVQGGVVWILPPLALMLTYGIVPSMTAEEKAVILSYKTVGINCFIGLVCLWVAVFFPQYERILCFASSLSFSCLLLINTYNRLVGFRQKKPFTGLAVSLIKTAVLIALPSLLLLRADWQISLLFAVLLPSVIIPYPALRKRIDFSRMNERATWAHVALSGGAVTIFIVLGELLWSI